MERRTHHLYKETRVRVASWIYRKTFNSHRTHKYSLLWLVKNLKSVGGVCVRKFENCLICEDEVNILTWLLKRKRK